MNHTLNEWGYPAKDRSGRLDTIEEPHLGRLMDKILKPAKPAADRLDYVCPEPGPSKDSMTEQTSSHATPLMAQSIEQGTPL